VKPDGEGNLHFVNGPVAVAVNAYGGSILWDRSHIGLTSSVTFGATVGPVADSWEFDEGGSGFVAFSTPSGGQAAILQVGSGTGTGVLSIRFQIISVFCETCQATAQVMSRPPGMSSVPQEDSYGQLRVYDLHGWLQEPDLDLEGRYGSATLRTWDTEACAIDPSLHTKWEIDSIYPIIVECPVE
jgi:hypothetical protein